MRYLQIMYKDMCFWIEVGSDSFAYRQIVLNDRGEYTISCREDCLAEGAIDETSLDGNIISISQDEFETVWNKASSKYQLQWKRCKACYPIGSTISGVFQYSYPQGSIISGNDFVALYIGGENFVLNKAIFAEIIRYDEMNMWLVVK